MNEIYASAEAHPALKKYIRTLGQLVEVASTDNTYPAVAAHADLYYCSVDGRLLSGAPAGYAYPDNIGYNGVQLGRFFLHNLKHTAAPVLEAVQQAGLEKIHVKQGYTKCNLVVVEDGRNSSDSFVKPAVITEDLGLVKTLSPYPIDVLPVSRGFVSLASFPYGFLGGASGKIGEQILFHGNLQAHPDFQSICRFIEARGKKTVWFDSFPLTDIGSIITLL